ncbi:MAG TPA: HAMP domain-containing sensor histidine kinase [Streptosporangiaceae bacterium]|nr:HAMP domain-containing sensor histidine kinase [Streptosporangiaceae bacterium]
MATHPLHPAGLGRAAGRLPGRVSLRVKLIAAVLALVTVALTVISVAGIAVLRGYLLQQADSELTSLLQADLSLPVEHYLGTSQPEAQGFSIQWMTKGGRVSQVAGEVSGFRYGQPTKLAPGPQVKPGDNWLSSTGRASAPVTVGATSGGGRWRVVSFRDTLPNPSAFHLESGTVIVGVDVTSVYRTLNELTVIDLIISAVLLGVLAVVGIAMIRTSMRPLTDIERTAQAIAAGDLARRVPDADPRTEIGRLGRSLNLMLAQIEAAFRARTASEEAARRSEEAARRSEETARQSALAASRSEERMRQFVADASHELRTPLTAIRGYAEYYRQRGGAAGGAAGVVGEAAGVVGEAAGAVGATDAADVAGAADSDDGGLDRAELDRIIERVEQEATRMGVLVDDMLLLARLDQQRPPDFRTVDLLAIAADALHDARVIAPTRTINLTVGTPDAALVIGDEVSLRQVVGNLMSNAMTHTPDGTPIDITIRAGTLSNGRHDPGDSSTSGESATLPPPPTPAASPAVVLEVTDRGPGLTDEQKEHVFERFYRTDRSRSRAAGGTGLGLAIVAALVDAHHGRVWVESQPGQGATFGFALPLAPEARAA